MAGCAVRRHSGSTVHEVGSERAAEVGARPVRETVPQNSAPQHPRSVLHLTRTLRALCEHRALARLALCLAVASRKSNERQQGRCARSHKHLA